MLFRSLSDLLAVENARCGAAEEMAKFYGRQLGLCANDITLFSNTEEGIDVRRHLENHGKFAVKCKEGYLGLGINIGYLSAKVAGIIYIKKMLGTY